MKSKILFFFLVFVFFGNVSYSQEQMFDFETKEIEIINDGNLINAKNGKAISKDKNLEIFANSFQYSNNTKILKIIGNGIILIKSDNLKIKFNDGAVDQNKQIFEAYGSIEVEDLNKKIKIASEKLVFNYKNNILFSLSKSNIKDNFKNSLIVDSFNYEIKKNLLKVNNLSLTDKDNNNLKTSIAYINTSTNSLYGKDAYVNLNNEILNKNNEPRLKGNSIINNETTTEIINGVFTTCKKRNGCPPWQLTAKKIAHNKEKKTINYENAFLKIYDIPVAYFPKFHHPDPTVKRESGFLTPSIKNSKNQKNFLNLPYFLVISDNKDATFSPRFYNNEEFLLQTEYRQKNYKSSHISDFSFKIDDDKNLKSHLLYMYDKEFTLDNFIKSDLNLKIQKTSKDTYIKKNKIKSELINDVSLLENSVKFNLSTDDMTASIATFIYEDLDKEDNDQFEYIIPKINFTKKVDNRTKLNGDFTFSSELLTKNYNTNVYETININDLVFASLPRITQKGFYNNYEFIIKNSNTNAKNSTLFKNKESSYLSGLFQLNSSLPLVKDNENYKKVFNPKLALKVSPNYTKDYRHDDTKIDVSNIYSLNRTVKNDTVEGGLSLTYGNDFSIFDKKNLKEIFNLKIANNIRLKENKDLPGSSQIGQKTSSILNEISYQPNEIIKIKYNSSIKNNLTDVNYENLITEFKINNLVTSFDYLNQNNSLNHNSYLTNITKLLIDESNILSFSTRRNKTIDLTEYYNLAYQYKNDCLSASIEYNKEYYNDRDIKPNESIFLKLTIIPFNKENSSDF
jgi:LPS-assembly protein